MKAHDWKANAVRRIEDLRPSNARAVRRLFKNLRQEIRALPDDDETAALLKRFFADMRRWERRDHIAMLRVIYRECLPAALKEKIRPDSIRRSEDPLA